MMLQSSTALLIATAVQGQLTVSPQTNTPLNGVTYNPFRYDSSCQSAANIDQDLQMLSTVAKNIRTYATGCSHEEFILQSAAKYNMTLTLGMWVDQWPATFSSQLNDLANLLKTSTPAMTNQLKAVVVGNEAMFRGEQNTNEIVEKIQIVKATLASFNLTNVQVTTSDITQHYQDSALIAAVDFLLPNIHVFFDNYTINQAPGELWVRYDLMKSISQGKEVIIGETGWPSAGASWDNSVSYPSNSSAAYFLNSFLCESNRRGLDYFYFDSFNADYKRPNSADEEYYWGLALSDRSAFKPYVTTAFTCTADSLNWTHIPTCNFNPYDDKMYTCTNNALLCPAPLVGCGVIGSFACYDQTKYSCTNGQLGPKQ